MDPQLRADVEICRPLRKNTLQKSHIHLGQDIVKAIFKNLCFLILLETDIF